jgi:hypothetical protein
VPQKEKNVTLWSALYPSVNCTLFVSRAFYLTVLAFLVPCDITYLIINKGYILCEASIPGDLYNSEFICL